VILDDLWNRLVRVFTAERTEDVVRAALILFVTAIVARFVGRWIRRAASGGDTQRAFLFGRLAAWGILFFGLTAAFQELGFKLSVLLGAAGVLSVAIGFASQTTLSNLISGFLLFGERPFRVGDLLEVDQLTGEVLNVEIMATTLRTLDNRFVRIPNEQLIKAKVVNQTRFPIRRLDLTVRIGRADDFEELRSRILETIDRHPLCLSDPPPTVFVAAYVDQDISIQVSMWTQTKDHQRVRIGISNEIFSAVRAVRSKANA